MDLKLTDFLRDGLFNQMKHGPPKSWAVKAIKGRNDSR
jgi:hypothetical protein